MQSQDALNTLADRMATRKHREGSQAHSKPTPKKLGVDSQTHCKPKLKKAPRVEPS